MDTKVIANWITELEGSIIDEFYDLEEGECLMDKKHLERILEDMENFILEEEKKNEPKKRDC